MPASRSKKGKAKAKAKAEPYEPSAPITKEAPPLDKTNPALHLQILEHDVYIVQYTSNISPPENYFGYSYQLLSMTQTPDETTIVISSADPVDRAGDHGEQEPADNVLGPMAGIKIKGPLELTMIGVLASFTATLRDANVSVFVISTW